MKMQIIAQVNARIPIASLIAMKPRLILSHDNFEVIPDLRTHVPPCFSR